MKWYLNFVVLVTALFTCSAEPYYGKKLGNFKTLYHKVAGEVYALDDSTLFIKNFMYDGTAPDAYFWMGSSSAPDKNGVIVPDEKGRSEKLGEYTGNDLILTLPRKKLSEISWLSVWCEEFAVDFGNVVFGSVTPPMQKTVAGFPEGGGHHVASGPITFLNEKSVKIEDFIYDGNAPDAFFLVGKTSPSSRGTKVPDENGSLSPLKKYQSKTITLTLPGELTFFDIDYISVYCIQFTENFNSIDVPQAIKQPGVLVSSLAGGGEPMMNCETMLEKNLNVAWKVKSNLISFTLSGQVAPGEYMSFGISGSSTKSAMEGADVIAAWIDKDTKAARAVDYRVKDYSLCSNGNGVCPDDLVNGVQDAIHVQGIHFSGVTTISFDRQLDTGDSIDIPYMTDGTKQYIVWAIGPINDDGLVVKHTKRLTGSKVLNFGRKPMANCRPVEGVEEKDLQGWPAPSISGENTKTFTITLGPPGGKRGYESITGRASWGYAFYVNGLLIPEIYLARGETYDFIINTGDNENVPSDYHPVYFATDPDGGYVGKDPVEKQQIRVLAGINASGKPKPNFVGSRCEFVTSNEAPPEEYSTFMDYKKDNLKQKCVQPKRSGRFKFSPNRNTPSLFYYQCWQHKYFGWKIHVVDNWSEVPEEQRQLQISTTPGSAATTIGHSTLLVSLLLIIYTIYHS